MKKEWFLKVLFVCGFICAGLFLFTMHSSAQFSYNPYSYQQPYTPYGPNVYQYLEDDYRPNYSKWNFTDSWTAYDPSGGGYGYQQPSYGYQQPSYGYQRPYSPNNPYVYPYADQAPYGYQPPLPPYGYYQGFSLANDMVGGYGYPSFSNPYAMYGDTRYFQ